MTIAFLPLTRHALVVCVVALAALPPTPCAAANMNKVVHHVFPVAETGFDPAGVHDLYSGTVVQAIFETLLTYDYLARPSKLVPKAAEALPQVTDGGRTYTFKVKKGVHFTDDPVFGGKKRELVAEDFAYSLKRLIDPKVRSPYAFLVEGKIVGLDEAAEAAKKSGKFDSPIMGSPSCSPTSPRRRSPGR
jgi:ABC-type oligopeptide transport system substrate-binding subunit